MRNMLIWTASFVRFAFVLRLVRWLVRRVGPRSRLAVLLRGGFDPNEIRRVRARALPPKYLTVAGVFGESFLMNVNDHIGWQTFIHSYFDLTPLSLAVIFSKNIASGPGVFVDVGANVGTTSVPIAKLGIGVIGIEASARAIHDLSRNVALNSPIPYSIVNLAVSSPDSATPGAYCELYSPAGNLGAASLIKNWNPSRGGMHIELARMCTLDRILDFYGPFEISLVKIDIEGLEYEAMLGLARTLADQSPPIIFEWRPDVAVRAGVELKDLRQAAPSHYRFYAVWKRESIRSDGIAVSMRLDDFAPHMECENVLAISDRFLEKNPAISGMIALRQIDFLIPQRTEGLQITTRSPRT
jgi:FkbM family methyltransferase